MNNQLVSILIACLGIWLAILTYIQVGDSAPELSASLQEGQAATVAYVHGDSIQANYEFIAERERALFVAVQQAQMAVERMATPLQEEAQELIAYASGPNVAEDEVQIAQSRLYEIEAQLAQIQNESQTRLVQLENQLQAEVAARLSEEVSVFAEQNGLEVCDIDTITELTSFVPKGSSYEADKGCHDDMVMNLVMFSWFVSTDAFGDIDDISLKEMLYKDRELAEDEMLDFGFMTNNGRDDEYMDMIEQQRAWRDL